MSDDDVTGDQDQLALASEHTEAAVALAAETAANEAGDGAQPDQAAIDAAAAAEAETARVAAEAAATEAAKPHGNKGKTPWYMERINEETNAKRALEAELARVKAEKEALAAAADPTLAAPTAKAAPDFQTAVRQEAEKIRFTEDCNAIAAAGNAEFHDFGQTLGILNAVGVTNDDFLMDIIATDKANAPKIMRALAEDPTRAKQLVNMNSRQRVAELVRMSIPASTTTATAKAANQISKAPAPRAGIAAVAQRDEGGLSDNISDEEWDRRYEKIKKNAANGASA
jgi:hypothetical protein